MNYIAEYIKEREGKEVVQDDNGFAVYYFENDYVFLQDVYVIPSKRGEKIGVNYMNRIIDIAKQKDYRNIVACVCTLGKDATISTKILLSEKFNILSSTKDMIYFIKEI